MRRRNLKDFPHQARRLSSGVEEAWWYENARSIDIYIQCRPGFGERRISIDRKVLADWLKRAEKKP